MPNEELAYTPLGDLNSAIPTNIPSTIPLIVRGNTLFEFLALKGQTVIAHRENIGSGVNPSFYYVPEGYVFFLTSASLSAVADGTIITTGAQFVQLRVSAGTAGAGTSYCLIGLKILVYNAAAATYNDNTAALSISPTIPLVIPENSNFYVYQQAGPQIKSDSNIQGFLCKKSDIPQIFGI